MIYFNETATSSTADRRWCIDAVASPKKISADRGKQKEVNKKNRGNETVKALMNKTEKEETDESARRSLEISNEIKKIGRPAIAHQKKERRKRKRRRRRRKWRQRRRRRAGRGASEKVFSLSLSPSLSLSLSLSFLRATEINGGRSGCRRTFMSLPRHLGDDVSIRHSHNRRNSPNNSITCFVRQFFVGRNEWTLRARAPVSSGVVWEMGTLHRLPNPFSDLIFFTLIYCANGNRPIF